MMCTPLRRFVICFRRRAAVDRLHVDPAVLADLRQLARDLQRELARRRKDQRLRRAVRRDQVVDDRQAERGGLAGAGARLDHQVLAHDRREPRTAPGSGAVAHVVERLLDVGVHPQIVPGRRAGGEELWRGRPRSGLDGPQCVAMESAVVMAALIAASTAGSCGVVSFVIVQNLEV
jgi:hypothetical protein